MGVPQRYAGRSMYDSYAHLEITEEPEHYQSSSHGRPSLWMDSDCPSLRIPSL